MTRKAEALGQQIGLSAACQALGLPRSRIYRERQGPRPKAQPKISSSPRRLSEAERAEVCTLLNSPDFADSAPHEVYASLLDEGRYLCSYRTMYRILNEQAQVRERRDQLRRPEYRKPELLATSPNQVWSWDITKLLGPSKWSYFYLYTILDIFSRYVVGWMVALQEAAHLAEELVDATYRKQGIQPGQLTLHADRGIPMTSKPLAFLLADLGVTKSHSRPSVSNDNPFSEAQFKTMKYRPDYPQRFGSLADARGWAKSFLDWYNFEHHHTGIALLTPAEVHDGRAAQVLQQRQIVLEQAYRRHPERFVRGVPQPLRLPEVVWINPPQPANAAIGACKGDSEHL
jgi:putative transposase